MTREEILTIFDMLLDNNQGNFNYKDSREELIYRLAYNDGILDMRDAIIKRIDNEAVENE